MKFPLHIHTLSPFFILLTLFFILLCKARQCKDKEARRRKYGLVSTTKKKEKGKERRKRDREERSKEETKSLMAGITYENKTNFSLKRY